MSRAGAVSIRAFEVSRRGGEGDVAMGFESLKCYGNWKNGRGLGEPPEREGCLAGSLKGKRARQSKMEST